MKMEEFMKEVGFVIFVMARDMKNSVTVTSTWEITIMVKSVEKASIHGQMEKHTMGSGL